MSDSTDGGGVVTADCRAITKKKQFAISGTELSNHVHTEEPAMEDVSGLEKDGEAPYSALKGPQTKELSGLETLKRSAVFIIGNIPIKCEALQHRLLC